MVHAGRHGTAACVVLLATSTLTKGRGGRIFLQLVTVVEGFGKRPMMHAALLLLLVGSSTTTATTVLVAS